MGRRRKEYPPDEVYLGKLCRRGHDHDDSGRSLRLKRDNHCIDCRRTEGLERYDPARAQAYYDKMRDLRREYAKDYSREHGNSPRNSPAAKRRRHVHECMREKIKAGAPGWGIYAQAARLILERHGPKPPDRQICHVRPQCAFDPFADDYLTTCWSPDNVFWGTAEENYSTLREDHSQKLKS